VSCFEKEPSLILFAEEAVATWNWWSLMAIPALVALNGYFVAAEFALVAIRSTRVSELVKQGVRHSKAVKLATDNLDRSIAATQLGITIASIALGWVGEPTFVRIIQPWFEFLPDDWKYFTAHGVAIAVAFTLITFMHVIFGELMPKTVALQSPDKTALLIARPLNLFAMVARPLILMMNGTSSWILKRRGYQAAGTEGAVHSVEELRLLIDDVEEAGILDEEQAEFVQNVFELADKTVRECMIPIEKVACLDVNWDGERILAAVRDGAHTRMPVYDGDLTKIVGIVNTKNLFYLLSLRGVVVLEDAIYPATFLPPDEMLASALRLFKRSRRPMALVRDDEEKIIGILTLEDVLEEIVGDIEDEHDRPMAMLRKKKPPQKK